MGLAADSQLVNEEILLALQAHWMPKSLTLLLLNLWKVM